MSAAGFLFFGTAAGHRLILLCFNHDRYFGRDFTGESGLFECLTQSLVQLALYLDLFVPLMTLDHVLSVLAPA